MIAVVGKELTDYRVPVFKRLQERLGEEVKVYAGAVHHSAGLNTADVDEPLPFPHEPLPTWWSPRAKFCVRNFVPAIRFDTRPRAAIVEPNIRNLAFLPMAWTFRLREVPVIGWGHGYSRARPFRPASNVIDRFHLAIVRSCNAYLCYTEETRDTLASYVEPESLFVAQNTLDTDALQTMRGEFESLGRPRIRQELGLDRRHYLGFVGRLDERKKPHLVLDIHEALTERRGLDLGTLIVGDGPERQRLERRIADSSLSDVHLLGARYGREAARWLFASDVMVMPGWLGLAVVHAFSMGVPVVSQLAGPGLVGHPPEASYIEQAVNGYLVPSGKEGALVEAVLSILRDRPAFSRNAVDTAETSLTLDRMIDGFESAIQCVTRSHS